MNNAQSSIIDYYNSHSTNLIKDNTNYEGFNSRLYYLSHSDEFAYQESRILKVLVEWKQKKKCCPLKYIILAGGANHTARITMLRKKLNDYKFQIVCYTRKELMDKGYDFYGYTQSETLSKTFYELREVIP